MDKNEKDLVTEPINTLSPVGPGANLDAVMNQAEKYVNALAKMREWALRATSSEDWIDQDGKPYLEWSGAAKIARAFGVSYSSTVFEKESCEDDRGKYIIYYCSGIVQWNNQEIPEIGSGSTRDSFFGRVNNTDRPLSEIDMTDIRKKAQTNFLNRGIKSLLGLSYTWQEINDITKGRITSDKCQGVKHGRGTAGGKNESAGANELRETVWKRIVEFTGDDKEAFEMLEKLTTWKKGDKTFPGKRDIRHVSEAQLKFVAQELDKMDASAKITDGGKGEK